MGQIRNHKATMCAYENVRKAYRKGNHWANAYSLSVKVGSIVTCNCFYNTIRIPYHNTA